MPVDLLRLVRDVHNYQTSLATKFSERIQPGDMAMPALSLPFLPAAKNWLIVPRARASWEPGSRNRKSRVRTTSRIARRSPTMIVRNESLELKV